MNRPDVPFAAPRGYRWEVVIDDGLEWTLSPRALEGLSCRRSTRNPCPKPPVVVMYRRQGVGRARYAYCGDHMYGRWIEDGRVVDWRLVPVAP